jgi:hypothetical protein
MSAELENNESEKLLDAENNLMSKSKKTSYKDKKLNIRLKRLEEIVKNDENINRVSHATKVKTSKNQLSNPAKLSYLTYHSLWLF